MASIEMGRPVYGISLVEPKHSLLKLSIHALLVYLACYGLISIYVDNIIVRSLKDVGMSLLAIYALSKVYHEQRTFIVPFLFLLGSIFFLGSLNLLLGGSFVALIYGFKITFLPMMMVFIGMLIAKFNAVELFARTNLFILVLLIIGWLIQYSLGIEKLISLGFVYGVNIKNYFEGVPRLPSITYSPDGYAYALLISGLIAEKVRLARNYRIIRLSIQLLTISFLFMSTIRSALVLWGVYQIVMFLLHMRQYNKRNLLLLSSVFFLLPAATVLGVQVLNNYNLLSVTSMLDRFQNWGYGLTSPFTMHGMIGNGIGAVGAASRRMNMIGLQSRDYAVDSQFFSFYEQIGLIGVMYISILFLWIMHSLIKRMKQLPVTDRMKLPQTAIGLVVGVAAASVTTNVLEMFPSNVFLWLFVGAALYQHRKTEEIP
ncbi:hypothetical protein MKY59_06130 [Paenibacillus sp. FSL W8-0426]|uniref:hypothetical protein n=1 Tax=Paenibacillus sp. FSL W8-0426 TaxID=2921714 RepID=UPI0030D87F26